MFKRYADLQGKKLIYKISNSMPKMIYGDHMRLQQVLINLIKNALKFTSTNGFVKINASYIHKSNEILVAIQDTGIGISEKDQEKLFKKFGKLKDIHKLNDKGVGLGLIICRHLTACHNGKIWLSSREMEGSTFSFTMGMPPVISETEEDTILERESADLQQFRTTNNNNNHGNISSSIENDEVIDH